MSCQLADLYTPLPLAVCELHARRAAALPEPRSPLEFHLANRPCAVLTRNLATPNFEMERFVSLATASGLSPLVLEFHRDKFVTTNPLKYAVGRLSFYGGTGRNGGPRVRCAAVIDLQESDGRPIDQLKTTWGQNLVEFHRELLALRPELSEVEAYDGSDWFAAQGPTARDYYTALLALFVQHAILIETFLLTTEEQQFTTEVVLPAFEAATALRGQRPLICRLDPPVTEGHPFWLQYPDELHARVAGKMGEKFSLSVPVKPATPATST